jgi:hypothetical protein
LSSMLNFFLCVVQVQYCGQVCCVRHANARVNDPESASYARGDDGRR